MRTLKIDYGFQLCADTAQSNSDYLSYIVDYRPHSVFCMREPEQANVRICFVSSFYFLSNFTYSTHTRGRVLFGLHKSPLWRNRVIITFMKSPRTFAQNGYIAICVITPESQQQQQKQQQKNGRRTKNFQAKCIPQLSQYTSTYNVTSFSEKETKKRRNTLTRTTMVARRRRRLRLG